MKTKRKVKANVQNRNTTDGLSALQSATNAMQAQRLVSVPVVCISSVFPGSSVFMNQKCVATAALPVTNGTFNQHPTASVILATNVRAGFPLQTPAVNNSTPADLNAYFLLNVKMVSDVLLYHVLHLTLIILFI